MNDSCLAEDYLNQLGSKMLEESHSSANKKSKEKVTKKVSGRLEVE